MGDYLMSTYKRQPVAFVRGEGVWLWDRDGNRYLDAVGGIAVCVLGHAHPRVSEAICQQARTLIHTSNLYEIPLQEQLGTKLCNLTGMERVFFANSGAEANEAAIKLARLYGRKKGVAVPTILVMERSFHGRTMATLTATGNEKIRAGFEPLVEGFYRVPYDDIAALEAYTGHPEVVAVMVEPIQGEGGVRIPHPDYLKHIHELCDSQGWLLILDEIQTGMGRTGHWFACQCVDVLPDIMTVAKGLANGVPIGACLAHGVAASLFQPGNHGSTFGGNPLATAAALAVIETLEDTSCLAHARNLGIYLLKQLQIGLASQPGVVAVRGEGLMIGIELDRPCSALIDQAREKGLLINVTADQVIRLLPPLILQEAEANHLVNTLIPLIKTFLS